MEPASTQHPRAPEKAAGVKRDWEDLAQGFKKLLIEKQEFEARKQELEAQLATKWAEEEALGSCVGLLEAHDQNLIVFLRRGPGWAKKHKAYDTATST